MNNTTLEKSGYVSKLCSYLPWSSTSINDKPTTRRDSSASSTSSSIYISAGSSFEEEDMEEEENYCFIKSTNVCVDATLTLISQLPVNYKDISQEFKIIHDYLDQTCHQFDHSRTIDQFTHTDSKMGPQLKSFMNFISARYAASPWLRCIGLIMIAKKVLYTTPREVKKELLQQTRIGREFVNHMQKALFSTTSGDLSTISKVHIMAIAVDEGENLFHLVRDICHEFADSDAQFELAYEQIIYYFGNQF